MFRGLTVILLVAFAACRDESAPAREKDEGLGQRVFRAPAGVVRAVPPHRIQPNSIGPYRLGAEFKAILSTLPYGPRVEVIQIERVVGTHRLVRVAQDAILVGIGQSGKASFIAALEPEIAKTEDGWGVGSEIDTLREALGPERTINGARDPRLVELARLPNARVVVEGHRVDAIVVGPDASADDGRRGDLGPADALSGGGASGSAAKTRPPAREPDGDGCTAASALEALGGEPVAETARAGDKQAAVHYGCFTGASPEAVVVDRDQLVLVGGEPGRLRKMATASVPGLLFASAVDVDGDDRHEVVAVAEKRSEEALTVSLEVLRGDGGRLVSSTSEELYRVDASLPVAKLKDIQLLIEAHLMGDSLEVGGLFLHWDGDDVRSVAPLSTRTVKVGSSRKRGEGPSANGGGEGDDEGRASEASASPERGGVRSRGHRQSAQRRESDTGSR
jgi:hypothetical protein